MLSMCQHTALPPSLPLVELRMQTEFNNFLFLVIEVGLPCL